jgi:small subunit ribosomal protein S9
MAEKIYATGRRKTSIARVWMKPGTGQITINKQPIGEYFRRMTLGLIVRQPLEHVGQLENYDVMVNVCGGGWSGQAGAVKMGIAKCLVQTDEKLKKTLREGGFITRDARKVERKKPGQKKARKRFQFSKR